MDRRFSLNKGPHIRRADFNQLNTKTMMIDVMIALWPLVIFAWYKNGIKVFAEGNTNFWGCIYPLLFVIIGAVSAYLFEALYYLCFIKTEKVDNKEVKINPFKKSWDTYSIIPGMMLAMILPLNTPIWVLLLGVLFAIVVAKMLFGGFGYNLFNPALVGYIFVMTAFYGVITKNGGYLNASEVIDITSGATPLADFKNVLDGTSDIMQVINTHGSLWKFFLGFRSGSLAETSGCLCLVSYAYLCYKKVINWKLPLIYIGTIFVMILFIGACMGYEYVFKVALFNVLTGGVMFAAVFMVTEPVTSPRNTLAKYIYTILIAVLTVVLRFLSNMPEGASTAILFMNMFSQLLDSNCSEIRITEKKSKKYIGYGIYVAIIIFLVLFVLFTLKGNN